MALIAVAVLILSYLIYPLILLTRVLLSFLRGILMPFFHVGSYTLYIAMTPFRILMIFEVRIPCY
jgi:hypothetical protein